jgi:hypothetical protein
MRRREFIAMLGGALACSVSAAVRARAQQPLAPQHRSAPPSPSVAQVVPQPVPQVTPQLNVPGPQTVPSPPGNPVRQLSPLGGANPTLSTPRIRHHGATRGRRLHRRHSG